MAFSKIVLTFTNWDSGDWTGQTVGFQVDGDPKNETAVLVRFGSGQFEGESLDQFAALNYMNAWIADYAGSQFTANRIGNVVTITATYDGAEFSDFTSSPGGRVAAEITNVEFDPEFVLNGATLSAADTNQCTTIKVTLTGLNGTPPYVWNTVLPGNAGLVGTAPRSDGNIDIEVEDDEGEISNIVVAVPKILSPSDISAVNITGDPSGLFGSVTVIMAAVAILTFEYSLDGVTFQAGNVFSGILPGTHTLYVKDQYGCTISQEFEVTLTTIRPPHYRLIPRTNSFGWHEMQAAVSYCSNPYNGYNAKPNSYKPLRYYNPKYFQPWCTNDSPQSQFRSNYDTLTAILMDIVTEAAVPGHVITIDKISDNIGQRQIMDAKIYDRGSGQTGVYFESGDYYDTSSTVIGSYTLDGQLPEWVKVGQTFSLTGSAADGIFEIVQIIFDSELLVNAAIINRVYADIAEPITVKVDAAYNKLNYETYQFTTDLSAVPEGCYKVVLTMEDSLTEYPTAVYETYDFIVTPANPDHVVMTSANHVDDGIVYGSIAFKQRFTGVFYEEDYPSDYETSRDSRKALNKLDGRVQRVFILDVVDVPFWVYEKLALFIAKEDVTVNGKEIQTDEPFEVERTKGYSRVNLTAKCFEKGYEQYMTNTYEIL